MNFTNLLLLGDEANYVDCQTSTRLDAMKNVFHVKTNFLFLSFWRLLENSLYIYFPFYKAIVVRLIKTKFA